MGARKEPEEGGLDNRQSASLLRNNLKEERGREKGPGGNPGCKDFEAREQGKREEEGGKSKEEQGRGRGEREEEGGAIESKSSKGKQLGSSLGRVREQQGGASEEREGTREQGRSWEQWEE